MSLRDLNIAMEYQTKSVNIAYEFLIPVLSESVSYKRAVGFFSSSALMEIAAGLNGLVKNGGKMQLIASPQLSENDVNAITLGYESREDIVRDRILSDLPLVSEMTDIEQSRFNFLAWLIANNYLDIRIAFSADENGIGIYHEKVGIVEDSAGNRVAFSGSMNESMTAMCSNYEVIDVFRSWDDSSKWTDNKNDRFDRIWDSTEKGVETFDFPEVKDRIVSTYYTGTPDLTDSCALPIRPGAQQNDYSVIELDAKVPQIPDYVKLRDYQEEAIESWAEQGYRGIFDMATGSGKTITGLAALTRLSKSLDNKLAVIIVCPYQHLVDQWVEDIIAFNMDPIIGYSTSPQRDWFKKLRSGIQRQRRGIKNYTFLCFVCTNGTFATDKVQQELKRIKGDILLIVDEAHNIGSERSSAFLSERYKYRLALSATIERYGDQAGTDAIFNYFGDRCIEYTLEEAIKGRNGAPPCLTPYRYYPIVVTLEEDELEQYRNLSKQIAKAVVSNDCGGVRLSETGKMLTLKRARLVAAARQKIISLRSVIKDYSNDNYILVYCGATRVETGFYDEDGVNAEDVRQIDAVTKMLGEDLGMKVRQFTSRETSAERKEIKAMYSSGDKLQALVAIKCLDEGVNIPMIKTAFILASTTNPREYIQRRGRLLRKDPQGRKERAEIYDFVTLPRDLSQVCSLSDVEKRGEKRLVSNELVRAKEFARLAENKHQSLEVLSDIEEAYFGFGGLEAYLEGGHSYE